MKETAKCSTCGRKFNINKNRMVKTAAPSAFPTGSASIYHTCANCWKKKRGVYPDQDPTLGRTITING